MQSLRLLSIFPFLVMTGLLCACERSKHVDSDEPAQPTFLALAKPVTGITIDGDIADWPQNRTPIVLSHLLEGGIENSDDLQAHFHIGYSREQNTVLFAVVVKDQEHAVDPLSDGLTDAQDQLLLYVDKAHRPKGSGVRVLGINTHHSEFDDVSTSWDPAVHKVDNSDIQVAVKRQNGVTYYEGQIQYANSLSEGDALGLDFMVVDADNDAPNFTRIAWRDSDGKTNVPFRLGHVFLVDEDAKTGKLTGMLEWADRPLGDPVNKVRISSVQHPRMWIRDEVDESGKFDIELPVGSYRVIPEWRIYNGGERQYRLEEVSVTAQVRENTNTVADTLSISTIALPALIPEEGVLISGTADRFKQLDAFVEAYMQHYEIPGVSLAIVEQGALSYHQSYGVSNTFTGNPVASQTIFEAASITKPVFAFAVMRLAEKGIIDLDMPLHRYLPFEDIAHDKRYRLITARHVLNHTTGFPNWRAGDLEMQFAPGTEFGYSGEGFQYLQRVVESISGKDVVDVLKEEVLDPLQLHNVYFEKNDALFRIVAHGHDNFYPHKISLPDKAGMAWSMHTEARSFARFPIQLMQGQGLSSASYADMFGKHTTTDKYGYDPNDKWGSYFGLGFQIEQTPLGTFIGHGGNNGDFKCEFKMLPELGIAFVVFTNGNTGSALTDSALERFLVLGQHQYLRGPDQHANRE